MNGKIRLWTRQDKRILDILEQNGRYIVKREYIIEKLDTCSELYFEAYNWYSKHAQDIVPKPKDVKYPIWTSVSSDFMLQPTEETVILELLIDRDLVVLMDTLKWDYIVNFWYIPKDDDDKVAHEKILKKYNLSDDSAIYMSNFYPHLKRDLIKSWDRLFDHTFNLSDERQAAIWEIKKEWIVNTKSIE